ncbi:hypothetical protein, partial [Pseudochelatococcus contaminans]|uniref:hypothetical protein n=1 Tax=Pseudochelatococcus contaminans TaxID=1538103 RepID=UPI001AEED5F7
RRYFSYSQPSLVRTQEKNAAYDSLPIQIVKELALTNNRSKIETSLCACPRRATTEAAISNLPKNECQPRKTNQGNKPQKKQENNIPAAEAPRSAGVTLF